MNPSANRSSAALQRLGIRLGAAVLATGLAAPARAADIIFPGIEAKSYAGAGQTVSRGATSLFYNPANLILTHGVMPEMDVSVAQVSYSYQQVQTDQFAPATLTTLTPMTTVGVAARPLPWLAYGLAFLPTGAGAAENDNGVPVEVLPGTFQALDLTRRQIAFRVAGGVAFRLASSLSLGVGIIYSHEQTQTTLIPSGTSSVLIDANYHGASTQFVIGLRYDVAAGSALALSFKSSAKRGYSGTLGVNSADSGQPPDIQTGAFKGVGFDPAVLGLGVETRLFGVGLFLDYQREFWAQGRGTYKQGLGADPQQVDFIDVNDIVAGARFPITAHHALKAAIGYSSANIGNGDSITPGPTLPHTGGVEIGQLEAIPRFILAGGYAYTFFRGTTAQIAGTYLKGSRTVPDGFDQPGTYALSVMEISAGGTYTF